MRWRLVIIGGPHVGKTTLSERLSVAHGITNCRHSDDVKHLGWSESSAEASKWFNESGEWIIEGVQMARALRKWLAANPEETLDADILVLDQVFGDALLPGQESMRKGVHTVFRQIEQEIVRRGARVHRLNHPDDAISLFQTRKANPEESGSDRRQKSMLKSTYKTLDEIPEGDRQHYKKIGDRYVLELDGEHPVQEQNKTVIEEKKTEVRAANQRAADAEAEVSRLKDAATKNPTLPSGHVAVPADEAKLLNVVKELGEGDDTKAKIESVKTKVTEHATLKTDNDTLKKTELLRAVADAGIAGKKLKVSALQVADQHAGGLAYEERDVPVTKDGKTTSEKVWHVKDTKNGNKWIPLSEYAESNWKDFNLTDVSTSPPAGTRVIGQRPSDPGQSTNLYSRIRDEQKAKQEKAQQESIPLEKRLGQVA